MTEYFLLALDAVLPFIIYMSFGYMVVHLFKMAEENFLRKLNTMVFKCFFPLLMFNNFYNMDLSQGFDIMPLLFTLAALLVMLPLLFLLVPRFSSGPQRTGVMIQALFRSNSILFAMPLSEAVCGAAGTAASTKLVAVIVPLFNVMAVIALEKYNGKHSSVWSLVKNVLTNPLILGAIAGGICLLLKVSLPAPVEKTVKAFADLTTPISLFILGGTLHFTTVGKNAKALTVCTLLKLIFIPMIIVTGLALTPFTSAEKFAVFCLFGTPVAVSSYTMAANMGGDGDLAGEFVAVTTITSLFTLFGWIFIMKMTGLI